MDCLQATYCVVDVETTGTDPENDAICQIAFVTTSTTQIIGLQHTLINPQRPMPAVAQAVHHISDADVAGAPVWPRIPFHLLGRNAYAAHFAEFDSQFCPQMANKPWLCTCRLAKKVYPDLEAYSNQFLRYHLELQIPPMPHDVPILDTMPHRAPADAWVTAILLQHLLQNLPPEAPRELWELVNWVNEPILQTKVTFGKYRGTKWADVPQGYLKWCVSSNGLSDQDRDRDYTIFHYLNSDPE